MIEIKIHNACRKEYQAIVTQAIMQGDPELVKEATFVIVDADQLLSEFLIVRKRGEFIKLPIKDLQDGTISIWTNDQDSGNVEPLQNGSKIYAYAHGNMTGFTCTGASFKFTIQVKNHPELATSKKIKIVFK